MFYLGFLIHYFTEKVYLKVHNLEASREQNSNCCYLCKKKPQSSHEVIEKNRAYDVNTPNQVGSLLRPSSPDGVQITPNHQEREKLQSVALRDEHISHPNRSS